MSNKVFLKNIRKLMMEKNTGECSADSVARNIELFPIKNKNMMPIGDYFQPNANRPDKLTD